MNRTKNYLTEEIKFIKLFTLIKNLNLLKVFPVLNYQLRYVQRKIFTGNFLLIFSGTKVKIYPYFRRTFSARRINEDRNVITGVATVSEALCPRLKETPPAAWDLLLHTSS